MSGCFSFRPLRVLLVAMDAEAEEAAAVEGGVTTEPVLFTELLAGTLVFAAGTAGLPIQCTTHPSSNLKLSTTLPSSREGIIFPLKMRRIDVNGIVVASDAILCKVADGAGEGNSKGMRRGGLVSEREIVIVSLLSLMIIAL